MYFSAVDGRYVCRASQTWGECTYSQSVERTVCQPIKVPPVVDDNTAAAEDDGGNDDNNKKPKKKLSAKAKRELAEKKRDASSYKAWLDAIKKLKVGPTAKSPHKHIIRYRKRK